MTHTYGTLPGCKVAFIEISQGHLAIVDAEDYEELSKFKWNVMTKPNSFYVKRSQLGTTTAMLMHRQIMQAPDGTIVDHINGNGLDNRRCNLRFATAAENSWNSRIRVGKPRTSRFRGVYKHKSGWQVHLVVNRKCKYIGIYKTEEDAARAYNDAALKYRGEFARLNDV